MQGQGWCLLYGLKNWRFDGSSLTHSGGAATPRCTRASWPLPYVQRQYGHPRCTMVARRLPDAQQQHGGSIVMVIETRLFQAVATLHNDCDVKGPHKIVKVS
nr:uncharacterized protein LOC109759482 [Aegilops tauschii subsp. strangulata]